ncbi:AAA family ATPase [Methanoplanus sp. FWC-SCC4]|uniref:AAA family ATPase n=1 Tax=Methanochimaera problematica TaxID=2609417 RepID=A0AA97I4W0_9EURY|nr:UvrD-helicase domain-containing protein [Methanoplanus sp. FWC-SCC4]WOF16786.1 AAA family ATPase [Methanoplanus sp. FWC-SCC4]
MVRCTKCGVRDATDMGLCRVCLSGKNNCQRDIPDFKDFADKYLKDPYTGFFYADDALLQYSYYRQDGYRFVPLLGLDFKEEHRKLRNWYSDHFFTILESRIKSESVYNPISDNPDYYDETKELFGRFLEVTNNLISNVSHTKTGIHGSADIAIINNILKKIIVNISKDKKRKTPLEFSGPEIIDRVATTFEAGSGLFFLELFFIIKDREFLFNLMDIISRTDLKTAMQIAGQPRMMLIPWKHQEKAVSMWEEANHYGVVEMATATGKTAVGMMAIEKLWKESLHSVKGKKVLVACHSTVILNQWRREIIKKMGIPAESGKSYKTGISADSITIRFETIQTIIRRPLEYSTDLLIIDEVHHMRGLKYREALAVNHKWLLGLTAQLGDPYKRQTISKELAKVVYEYPILQALKDGIIPEFSWVVHPVYLDIKEQADFLEISGKIRKSFNYVRNDKGTILHITNKKGFSIKSLGDFIYLCERARLTGKALPDQWKALQALVLKRRQIIHTSQPRLEKALELAKSLGNKHKIVIFLMNIESCNFVGRELKKYFENVFVIHSQIKERPIDIVNKFIAVETGILIGADMLNEGIDIKSADIGINLAFTKSRLQLIQRMGRVLRKDGNKKPTFYQLVAIPERSFYVEEMDAELFIDDLAWVQSSALHMGLDLNIEWKDSELAEYQGEAERFFRLSHENKEFSGNTGTFNFKSAIEEFSYTAVRRIPGILQIFPGEELTDRQWEDIIRTAHATVNSEISVEKGKFLNLSRAWYILILCGRDPVKLANLFKNALKTIEKENSEYVPLPEMALDKHGTIFFPCIEKTGELLKPEVCDGTIEKAELNSDPSVVENHKVTFIKKSPSQTKGTKEAPETHTGSESGRIVVPAAEIKVPSFVNDIEKLSAVAPNTVSPTRSDKIIIPTIPQVKNHESDFVTGEKGNPDFTVTSPRCEKTISEIFSLQNVGDLTKDKLKMFLKRLRKDMDGGSAAKIKEEVIPPKIVINASEEGATCVQRPETNPCADEVTSKGDLQSNSGINTDESTTGEDYNEYSGFPDIYQKGIIETRPGERIIVDAGPGTGKTAVACARVAWLIDRGGISPVRVWLVSFTRTAVKEIQSRISEYLDNPDDVYSIRIATLDSHAWNIHSGFDDAASLTGSYEDTIEKLTQKINEDGDEADYIKNNIRHLIIDEAQDIVSPRSELILSIIDHMSEDAGISVFSDDAQAIYGFAEKNNDESKQSGKILTGILKENYPDIFSRKKLEKIHRTKSLGLCKIFHDTRLKVLDQNRGAEKFTAVRDDILSNSEEIKGMGVGDFDDDDCFVLFRKKAEVLRASAFTKTDHRLRMSGLPVCILPWVGIVLNDFTEENLKKNVFTELWDERISGTSFEVSDSEKAWDMINRLSGKSATRVSMTDLRIRLGAQRPPAGICYPEFGCSGPVLSTIHASKGRETKEVRLIIPEIQKWNNIDYDEEARVFFVAATRARERLLHGRGYQTYTLSVNNCPRVFGHVKNKRNALQVQIGLENDISAECISGKSYFELPEDVESNIKTMMNISSDLADAFAWRDYKSDYTYRIALGNPDGIKISNLDSSDIYALRKRSVAVLSKGVNNDIFKARSTLWKGYTTTPSFFKHLHIFGLRTIVVPPDDSIAETLHYPWCESGIMPAPIISGFPTIYFN